jgi:hypothetical protein
MKPLLHLGIATIAFCMNFTPLSLLSESDKSGAGHIPDRHVLENLSKLAASNPVADFAAAKKKGDRRFLAIMGYAKTVPGVPEYDKKYAKYVGTKLIPGTTDAVLNEEHRKILDAVQRYAERYNKLVLAELPKIEAKAAE